MTDIDLAAIRARAAATTPWAFLDFIAAARTDIPALCDELERLALEADVKGGIIEQAARDIERLTRIVDESDAAVARLSLMAAEAVVTRDAALSTADKWIDRYTVAKNALTTESENLDAARAEMERLRAENESLTRGLGVAVRALRGPA